MILKTVLADAPPQQLRGVNQTTLIVQGSIRHHKKNIETYFQNKSKYENMQLKILKSD